MVIFDIFGGVLEFVRGFDKHIMDDQQDGKHFICKVNSLNSTVV